MFQCMFGAQGSEVF